MANTVQTYTITETTTNVTGTIEKGSTVKIIFTSPDNTFAQVEAVGTDQIGLAQAYVPTSILEGFVMPPAANTEAVAP